MMMDKLTQKSQEALQAAQELARERSHQELDGPHLTQGASLRSFQFYLCECF